MNFPWSCSPSVGKIHPQGEKFATDDATKKLSLLLTYVDDTFIIWIHGLDDLQIFWYHLNNLSRTIMFSMEVESNGSIPFLDVLKGSLLGHYGIEKANAHWTLSPL